MTQCKSCGAEIRWAQGPSRPLCLNAEPAMVASGWQLTSASGHSFDALRYFLRPEGSATGAPDSCDECPFATVNADREPPNPDDPPEGYYDCALLARKAVWGEDPVCSADDWRAYCLAEAERLQAENERLARNVETANMDAYLRGKERDALKARVARLETELEQAGITMRNYYGHAISRARVDEQIERIRALLAETEGTKYE